MALQLMVTDSNCRWEQAGTILLHATSVSSTSCPSFCPSPFQSPSPSPFSHPPSPSDLLESQTPRAASVRGQPSRRASFFSVALSPFPPPTLAAHLGSAVWEEEEEKEEERRGRRRGSLTKDGCTSMLPPCVPARIDADMRQLLSDTHTHTHTHTHTALTCVSCYQIHTHTHIHTHIRR